jgi:F-type H+-transporting ATPase subunit a
MAKIIIGVVVAIIVMIVGNIILPVPRAAIEVAAEPIGLGPVLTNAVVTSFILSIIIVVLAFVVGRNLKEIPTGLQNIVEVIIEGLDNLINDIAPKKWIPTFFPILATIFIYLLFANWFSLLTPLLGSFGIVHLTDHGGVPISQITFVTGSAEEIIAHDAEKGHGEEAAGEGKMTDEEHGGEPQALIVPLFRAPSSDLNLTFALALMSVILTQIFGFRARGIGYLGNFIRLKGFSTKGIGMGFIDFAVGILELVSEFAKIISFSFRLFGNIFAGEVVLIVIISLVSLLLILIFFGLEIFVGFIQAFVFFILSLVFFSMATQEHGEEH